MKTHYLKTWPTYYDAVKRGEKTFEGRWNDRDFKAGDTVVLMRTIADESGIVPTVDETGEPTHLIGRRIGFVLHGGKFGIQEGWCVFSLLDEAMKGGA